MAARLVAGCCLSACPSLWTLFFSSGAAPRRTHRREHGYKLTTEINFNNTINVPDGIFTNFSHIDVIDLDRVSPPSRRVALLGRLVGFR